MRPFFTLQTLAAFSLAAVFGLAGCTSKEKVEPTEGCGTVATVRFCRGNTAVCPTQHTDLELLNGTRLRPSGPVWDTYQAKQVDGQMLTITYALAPQNQYNDIGFTRVTLSCLEEYRGWYCAPPQ